MAAIARFAPEAIIISLGLDTHDEDPCAFRRAGFCLKGDDYTNMGRMIGECLGPDLPVVIIQEGGYRMDKIGEAAANLLSAFRNARL